MSTPSAIQVAKTFSGPANPSAPSFLTNLPPEIRNIIYEFLFKRDGPVLLHDSRAYQVRLRSQEATKSTQRVRSELDIGPPITDEEFHHGLGHYIALLSSCRQVYHEAAGILYNTNTFLFSRVLDQHTRDEYEKYNEYNQMQSVVTWLTRLGSQIALLTRVQIDADAVCRDGCRRGYSFSMTDLLPFLRIIWANPHASFAISFAHTGRFLHCPTRRSLKSDRTPVDILNNVLITIGKHDVLNLRRYSRYKPFLSSISISGGTYGNPICVIRGKASPRNEFVILENGKVVRARPKRASVLEEFDLPRLIFKEICLLGGNVIFDLDLKTAGGMDMGLLGVNRNIRTFLIHSHAWKCIKYVLTMATDAGITNFEGFRALRQWSRIPLFWSMLFPHTIVGDLYPEIQLEFRIADARPMDALRIDIRVLLRVLARLDGRSTIRIKRRNTTKKTSDEVSMSWTSLRLGVFLLLSDVIKHWPSEADGPLPQIWIDGAGNIIRATYPTTGLLPESSVVYAYTGLSDEDLDKLGDEYGSEIGESVPFCSSGTNLPASTLRLTRYLQSYRLYNKLAEVWRVLREGILLENAIDDT